jgi:hypothetical protein
LQARQERERSGVEVNTYQFYIVGWECTTGASQLSLPPIATLFCDGDNIADTEIKITSLLSYKIIQRLTSWLWRRSSSSGSGWLNHQQYSEKFGW